VESEQWGGAFLRVDAEGCVVFWAEKFGGFEWVDGGDISAAGICPRKPLIRDGEISLIHGLEAEILRRKGQFECK
jgi:hypothetical protein